MGKEEGRKKEIWRRVLRLWGDLERGYMGGVWVRRQRTREKRAAWVHGWGKAETGSSSRDVIAADADILDPLLKSPTCTNKRCLFRL